MVLFRTLSLKTVCCVIALAVSVGVSADVDVEVAPTAEALEAARDALQRFNQTSPYLNLRDDQDELRRWVDDVCWAPQPDCLAYLRGQRLRMLRAIPNNPAYWARWREYLTVGPAGLEHFGELSENPRTDYSKIMDLAKYMILRDLALDGELDVVQFAEVAGQLRRLLVSSGTVLERMIYSAAYTQLMVWANVAMAVSSARFDDGALQALREQLRPLTRDERDFTRVVAGEAAFMRRSLEVQPQIADAVLEKYDLYISPYEREQNTLQMQKEVDAFPERSAVIVALSQRAEAELWKKGTGLAPVPHFEDPSFDASDITMTWRMYIGVDLVFNLHVRIMQRLADIYAGHVSPGLPAHAAPTGWRWDWRDDTQQLCLEAVSVHPSAVAITNAEAICHVYLEPAAVDLGR